MVSWAPDMSESQPPRVSKRDEEQYRLLYSEKFDRLKEEVARLNERLEKGEARTDERLEKSEARTDKLHEANQERFGEMEKTLSSMKVKMGAIIAATTSLLTTALTIVAHIVMKKLGL